jgi:hypothetical protein
MTLRTNVTAIETVLALLAGAVAGVGSASIGLGVISCLLTFIAIGVWRGIRFLGVLVESSQAAAADEQQPSGS